MTVWQMSLKILDFCYLAAAPLYHIKGTPQCCNSQVRKHCNTGHQHVPLIRHVNVVNEMSDWKTETECYKLAGGGRRASWLVGGQRRCTSGNTSDHSQTGQRCVWMTASPTQSKINTSVLADFSTYHYVNLHRHTDTIYFTAQAVYAALLYHLLWWQLIADVLVLTYRQTLRLNTLPQNRPTLISIFG